MCSLILEVTTHVNVNVFNASKYVFPVSVDYSSHWYIIITPSLIYNICLFRSGSLFSLSVYNVLNDSLIANTSILVSTVTPYQFEPSTVYVGGLSEDFPTIGTGAWHGCLSHLSVNGRFLNLLQRDSKGTLPTVCSDMRYSIQRGECEAY